MKLGSTSSILGRISPTTTSMLCKRMWEHFFGSSCQYVGHFPFSPSRGGWGCFLFTSCQMRGHFKKNFWRAWHILRSLRDTGTDVWLTPKRLKTNCGWLAPWEDRRGEKAAFGTACTLKVPEFLWTWCGSQEREPDLVIKKESNQREHLVGWNDLNGGEAAGNEGAGQKS